MKEVLIFFSICLISASVHENGATKLGHKSVRHRKLFNERWTRDNLVRKEKGKRLKLNSSDKKENASYMKRQFVPEMPAFFNFPHPHIHRIIVHHHPAHSTCEPIPCQNGGTCTVVAHGYECTCSPGFMGTHCELRSQCEPNPCRNGGTCYDVGQGYECTCSKGYRGQNCEEQNKCHPNPCRNGGTCTGINEGEGFECTCREGFKGKNCEEINLCLPNPCKNGATCTERVGGRYECTCPIGYKGITCEERSICYSNPCMNGGTCLDETYGYRCSCRMGYSGMNCQNHVCRPNPCHNGGSCLEEGSSYRCVCHVGNHGDRCELLSSCLSHPCLHGGTCIDTYFLHNDMNAVELYSSPSFVDSQQNAMAYICKCIAPFAGRNCEDDSCRYCSPNAECILGHCVCKESYHGDGKTCKRNVCHPNPCKNSGTCVPTDSSYDCECMLGWTGPHCETRQYCIPNPCKNGGTCIPEESGYRCTCLHNYEGNDCELANPCSPNPCKNSGTCKEMNGVATCECPAQFEGNFCDVDKCAKCDSHARCDNGNCICMEGWVGDGQTCSPQTETPSAPASLPSPPSPPPPSLPAIVGAPGSPGNSYGSPSSYGPPSDMPTAPTSRASPCDSNPCQNGGQCLDEGNAYQCLCKEGFSGNNCELGIGKANPCDPNPCQNGGQCTAVDSKPVCACPEEFEGNFCEMPKGGGVGGIPGTGGGVSLNSACHPNPCMNGGSCTENGGGYDCACVVQYSGPNCEIDECEKCDIHALCANGHCRCKSGYYGNGFQCEKEESECEGCSPFASCQNGICVCLEQYTGNGYDCAPVNPCTSCRPPNICVQGSCLPGMTKKSRVKNIKKKRFVPKGKIV